MGITGPLLESQGACLGCIASTKVRFRTQAGSSAGWRAGESVGRAQTARWGIYSTACLLARYMAKGGRYTCSISATSEQRARWHGMVERIWAG